MSKVDTLFEQVETVAHYAKLAAWDGCHKIYLAMDNTQADWFKDNYEYVEVGSPEFLADIIREWYDRSCGLRFVDAVSTNEDDANAGFVTLIGQFDDEDDYDYYGQDYEEDE